ncbi:MAG: flagellar hook-associated protein FlgK, partial [Candidatus Hydrogenedentes bacterium]|nr:flagellar hook-associated protein FlgK [Candidatus Hydrogenedentota bacterium]
MGTLFSTLSIARSGMQIAQVQLDIAGHNIANVNKVGFSRQRVELISRVPLSRPFGQIGRGVAIGLITRVRDPFLDTLFRNQVAGLLSAELQTQFFGQIEDIFLEPTESGMSGRINNFFQALQEFSTNVESLPIRQSVVTEAESLAALFNDVTRRLNTLRTNANEEIVSLVPEVNSFAERIAKLNEQIRVAEAGGNPANDLRDDRDVLLDQLAGIVNIFTRERTNGQVDVLIGDQVLVDGDRFRELETVQNALLDPVRNDLVDIRFVDNGNLLTVQDGSIFGALELRDTILVEIQNDIDTLAATMIREINVIHTQGNGLVNLTSFTGLNFVSDPALALNLAGLPFTVTPGTFEVELTFVDGFERRRQE